MQRDTHLVSTVIVEHHVDPSDVKIQVINGILHSLGFEVMQIGDLPMLPNNAFCKHLFCTMNIPLHTNNVKDQRFLIFCRLGCW